MKRRNNRMQGILALKARNDRKEQSTKATPAARYDARVRGSERMCARLDKTMNDLMKTIEKQAKR